MDYARQQRKPTRHMLGITVVVGFHLVLVWALQQGLGQKVMNLAKKPIDAKLIEEAKPKELPPPPPPPPPKTKAPPPPPDFVPPPEISAPPSAGSTNAIAAVTRSAPAPEAPPAPPPPPPPPPPAAPHVPVVVAPVVTAGSCEKPEYPAASRRAEEQGTVVLRFLVAESGQVVESKVESSSGSARLDEAARQALSRCKFKPGTTDGVPQRSWASLKYTWRLE